MFFFSFQPIPEILRNGKILGYLFLLRTHQLQNLTEGGATHTAVNMSRFSCDRSHVVRVVAYTSGGVSPTAEFLVPYYKSR